MTLSSSNRKHALSALAALSKYQGRYDQYLQLKQRYSLRWTSTSSVQSLQRFFNPDLTFDVMLSKVKEMIRLLPEPMALVIKHAVLTGLRSAEAVESVRLLNDISSIRSGRQQQMYYNPERQTLEHFRFPDMFLRQTKKAFISYITLDNLQPIAKMGGKIPTWNAIRLACRRMKLNMNMSFTVNCLHHIFVRGESSLKSLTYYRAELANQYLHPLSRPSIHPQR
jgi:hypothetical protein